MNRECLKNAVFSAVVVVVGSVIGGCEKAVCFDEDMHQLDEKLKEAEKQNAALREWAERVLRLLDGFPVDHYGLYAEGRALLKEGE